MAYFTKWKKQKRLNLENSYQKWYQTDFKPKTKSPSVLSPSPIPRRVEPSQ